MNGNYKNEEDVIDLSVLFGVLLKNLPLLIIMMVLGAAAAFSYTKYLVPERYEATATVIINNKTSDTQQYITAGDLSSSKNLAELYSIIITSDTVLDKIMNDMGDKTTYTELKSVKVETISESQVVKISMTSTDPQHAKEIVEKFVKYSKPVIMDKVDAAGSVKDLNDTVMSNNGNPVSPNKKKNTLIGALAGFVLGAAIVILKELLNNTLKTEADVKNALDVPLLGVVPKVDRKEFSK